MWVRFEIPSTTMRAGSAMEGRVIVTNNTGYLIHAGNDCGGQGLFDVGLGNDKIKPQVDGSPACLGSAFTVPIGESTWPVGVTAQYGACGETESYPALGIPRCRKGKPPALPPGDYRAVLFGPLKFPNPIPINVLVMP
jgi:hypothetical protein